MDKNNKAENSYLRISMRLIAWVKPLSGIMILAVFMGVVGHICAIAIPVLGAYGVIYVLNGGTVSFAKMAVIFVGIGALRALCHYVEQLANHHIAFKILAIIRSHVFSVLRKLAPAKLEGRDSGTLVSALTSDIELLEVFYAHTISPVSIATCITVIMCIFFGTFHIGYAVAALTFYLIVGILVPIITSMVGKEAGMEQRKDLSQLNSFILDSFRGIRECVQFGQEEKRSEELGKMTRELSTSTRKLSNYAAFNINLSLGTVLLGYLVFLSLSVFLYNRGAVDFSGVLIPSVAFMSSFGPVLALSNLANNLLLTFACGKRVFDIMDEIPVVDEKLTGKDAEFNTMALQHVDFSYGEKPILKDWNFSLKEGEILGIKGKSGCGKSTALKLLMRVYDPDKGQVTLNNSNLKDYTSSSIRKMESYMSQSTHLFDDTLLENVRLARIDATDEEVYEACKKAAIDETIRSFPEKYDTKAGTLGNRLSAGERQRIGLARAFLHGGSVTLLDEPTANLDSLNEAIILKSIKESVMGKTVLIVSHKQSTLKISDRIIEVKASGLS